MQENHEDTGPRDALLPFADLYGFDTWPDSPGPEGDLFVVGVRFDGLDLPDWNIARQRELHSLELPRTVRALLQLGQGEAALLVEIYECDSRTEAQGRLLDLLSHFQGPALERNGELGDVGFAARDDMSIVFARANLAMAVRNAGNDPVAVREAATRIDTYIKSPPEPTGPDTTGAPAIKRFRRSEHLGPGGAVALDIEVEDREGRDVWLKLFATEGRLFREQDRLLWTGPAPSRLTLYAIAGRTVSTESLALD